MSEKTIFESDDITVTQGSDGRVDFEYDQECPTNAIYDLVNALTDRDEQIQMLKADNEKLKALANKQAILIESVSDYLE